VKKLTEGFLINPKKRETALPLPQITLCGDFSQHGGIQEVATAWKVSLTANSFTGNTAPEVKWQEASQSFRDSQVGSWSSPNLAVCDGQR